MTTPPVNVPAAPMCFGPRPVAPDLTTPAAALTAALATAPDDLTTPDAAEKFIHSLTALGVPLVPVDPGEDYKRPLWNMKFSDATTDLGTWSAWLPRAAETVTASGDPWGLGAALGSIGNGVALSALDADTPAEDAAARAALAAWGMDPETPPTVSSPGTVDRRHHGGGHWWFIVPANVVTGEAEKVGNGEAPAALFTGNRQILIPPTRRAAGAYRVTGEVYAATPQMIEWLTAQRVRRAKEATDRAAAAEERQARLAAGEGTPRDAAVDAFEDAVSWADLLTEAGWSESTRRPASCGCRFWNRPGFHSEGSAVAHERCVQFGTVLHANSDAVNWSNVSKMQFREKELGVPMTQTLTEYGAPSAVLHPLLDLRARVADIVASGNLPATSPSPTDEPEETPIYDTTVYPAGHPNDPALLHDIFDFNDFTRAIYHSAREAEVFVAPVAKLIMELVNTARMTGPDTRTEFDDGLGLCVALASRSGGGKSVALDQLEADQRTFTRPSGFRPNMRDGGRIIPGLASGQALVDALTEEVDIPLSEGAPKGSKPDKRLKLREPAVVTVAEDELDNLAKKSSGGSTLTNAILSAWSERPIGDLSRTHGDKNITRDLGHFMLNLLGGIQPARAEPLVGSEAVGSGLAQRLFFVGLEDLWYADPETGDLYQDAAGVAASGLDRDGARYRAPSIPSDVAVGLPDEGKRAMRIQNAHTALGDQRPGDTHLNRIRIRLATLMALTMGETEVSPEVWDWSAALMEHRRRTLAFVETGARTAAQDEADEVETRRARGRVAGAAAVAGDIEGLAAELLGKIAAGTTGLGALKRSVGRKKRANFDSAIRALEAQGAITSTTGARGAVTYAAAGH